MIRKLVYVLIFVALFPFAGSPVAASQRMAVKSDVANIRAKPDVNSDTLWQIDDP